MFIIKIIIVYNGYFQKGGGVVTFINLLINKLNKYRINNIKVWSREDLPRYIYFYHALIQRLFDFFLPGLGHIIYSNLTRNYLLKRKILEDYDMVIFNDLSTAIDKYNHIVILHSMKSDLEHNSNFFLIKKYIFTKVQYYYEKNKLKKINKAKIYTVSHTYKNILENRFKLKNKIKVLYPPLDMSSFYKIKKEQDKNRNSLELCYLGALTKIKNPLFAIKVLYKLKGKLDKNIKLHIIGDGYLKKKLIKTINGLNLQNDVIIYGRIDNKTAMNILNKCDILLHPSNHETFCIALLEAKLYGLVTIANSNLHVPKWLVDFSLKLDINLWVEKIISTKKTPKNVMNKINIVINHNFNRFLYNALNIKLNKLYK